MVVNQKQKKTNNEGEKHEKPENIKHSSKI